MPIFDNQKHELFAQELSKGRSAEVAYAAAGHKPPRQNTHRLITNEDVFERLNERQAAAANKAEWAAADRLRDLEKIARANLETEARCAIAAIAEASRMQGSHAPSSHKHHHSGSIGLASKEQRDAAVAALLRADT